MTVVSGVAVGHTQYHVDKVLSNLNSEQAIEFCQGGALDRCFCLYQRCLKGKHLLSGVRLFGL